MTKSEPVAAIEAAAAAPRKRASNYPEPFASRVAAREKRPLGNDDPWHLTRKNGTPY